MIFVTVGTSDRGFDRLLREVDRIAPEFDEQICAQIGQGEYIPENLDWFRFTSEKRIHELYQNSSATVAHAGAGTVLTALSYNKPIVILPRRERYDEHNDDHQLELANALADRPSVFVVTDQDELKSAINQARLQSGTSNFGDRSLVGFLDNYLEELKK